MFSSFLIVGGAAFVPLTVMGYQITLEQQSSHLGWKEVTCSTLMPNYLHHLRLIVGLGTWPTASSLGSSNVVFKFAIINVISEENAIKSSIFFCGDAVTLLMDISLQRNHPLCRPTLNVVPQAKIYASLHPLLLLIIIMSKFFYSLWMTRESC